MNSFLLNEIARSNAIYNLSGADDDQDYQHESEMDVSEGDKIDNDEQDDSDHSADNDNEHIPTAPCFTTEEINVSSGNCSNVNPLDNDLFEGQNFADKQTAISAVKANHIKNSRDYHVIKSDTTRYEAKCVVEDCSWRMRVMKLKQSGFFVITKLPAEHNYILRTLQRDHKQLTSRMIANVTESPYLKVNNIMSQITSMYNYNVTYKKAWIGKQKAISYVYGDWMTSYNKLPTFLSAVMHFNPGTVALIDVEADVTKPNTSVCKRVWWVFKPMIDGWQHARLVISIDGTFLKGKYNGKLLVAMGSDSNNQQYPIAYGLVHEESTVNWSWFLYHFRIYVCQNRKGVCIISDRHPGIIEVMKRMESEFVGEWGMHRFCLLHVRSNFCSTFPGSHLKMLCWAVGNTSQL
ncbi:uncharacterized protein LOC141660395 [Apium graveolens]|uniref:uncharacterized protein LOC141660395 n=1 Tax=Apium graveolens TaxID=4045 RepID=UPI003D78BEEA